MDNKYLKLYFTLSLDDINPDYSDIDSDDKMDAAREGIIDFARYKLDIADWVGEYDYSWGPDSATVEIWIDPDFNLTEEEIDNKIKDWEDWYYIGTIIQYGTKHPYDYYEEPEYDEHEVDATLFFDHYEWASEEEI